MEALRNYLSMRTVLAALLAGLLALGAYAYMATNTVPATKAGEGADTISGYAVSNVNYQLNATTPSDLDAVSFTLDDVAGVVKAKVVSSSSTYTDCANTAGNDWSCDLSPDVAVSSADELSVIATE